MYVCVCDGFLVQCMCVFLCSFPTECVCVCVCPPGSKSVYREKRITKEGGKEAVAYREREEEEEERERERRGIMRSSQQETTP